ncbi:MAG TPA: phage tail protein [Aquabacterium sp.]|uniref:phage tail protein n=1 Tax=Aquabacterium sp. TaxID=1872578 RepID=UPI002E35C578|nr:phage tail protein [Aquabacterium sp.]HEX5373069.1 phage tail protein [Aquabacterium sp.]
MADPFLLTSFRFEVRLLKSPDILAGRQRLPAAGDGFKAPSGGKQLTEGAFQGSFQDCTGLEIEMDVQEYLEGGRNNGVVRRVGRAKYAPLVLKRGMFHAPDAQATVDPALWYWMQRILNGERPVPRYDGIVQVMSADKTVRATWVFDRALPSKIKGPELNARTGEVAIEELTLVHEGLRLLPAEPTP